MKTAQFTPKIFTLLSQRAYSFRELRADSIAGLTVAVVALPLSMALAIASGASPDKGLTTAVIAGFLISFLGGSRVQIGGPTGAFVVVVYGVIAQYGYDGLLIATFLAGLILIFSGYARLGQLISFIPHPVVTGFTGGIAVIIATSQVKDFFGLQLETVPADFLSKWHAYIAAFDTINPAALAVGIAALFLMTLMRYFVPRWPSYLIVLVFSSLLVAFFPISLETVGTRFPDMPTGLPMPALPVFDLTKIRMVIPSAFIIAFLAGIEALLSAAVADGMTGFKHRSNQELIAQGSANIASAFFGGLPATGAIARTATNIKAGGRTPFAGIFHAVFLCLFVLFGTDLIVFVPMTALAAILFIVAWNMSEFDHFVHIFRLSWADRNVMLLTFLLTVFVDLTVAIAVGVILASLLFIRHMVRSFRITPDGRSRAYAQTDEDEDENEDVTQRVGLPSEIEVFRITGPIFFGVTEDIVDTLKAIRQMPQVLILRMRLVPYLDATGINVLETLLRQCHAKGTRLILAGVQAQPADIIQKSAIMDAHYGVILCSDYKTALVKAKSLLEEDGHAT